MFLYVFGYECSHLVCYCRTLNLAKTIIKEKLCVRSKADKVIDISKDEKIEEVSLPFLLA